mmetsp:Transcript_15319/g.35213  ORF Transcript_15319/g.35213 Transcript_15319/m.35213 type:complete len:522 (+) Transcript_15319:125-1690(+)|eukprot:CAMPEP_0116830864 /NCGR_PEP_ID=MMETSP0418-20121206/5006_1 /TAXON_ID=1158023 /ORGANISM="Astrosyne radiata, Strain 13vi08-1A" /LENGTH=521 /DNA_ID=CAMNT_0004460027 /DNA_START=115 /DNA_END=1680 /DNA_ORIENTATION=-
MAYRLKTVQYKNADCKILLQNENGPCPLLAAANALLLKGAILLPPECTRNGVATIDDVVNILAEHALGVKGDQTFHLHEMLTLFPSLQYGMDVNPKFTSGPTGVEYTSNVTAFEMLGIDLVHGWLLDPQEGRFVTDIVQNKTYNELIEMVIKGNEADAEIQKTNKRIQEIQTQLEEGGGSDWVQVSSAENEDKEEEKKSSPPPPLDRKKLAEELEELKKKNMDDLAQLVLNGSTIKTFLDSSAHQLTQFGLMELYKHLQEESLCVFFRNNHFATLTKHEGVLYLLVTDLGYASVPEIMWEKLDVIDGDTEYVSPKFTKPAPHAQLIPPAPVLSPEQLLAQRGQSEVDYQLALELSKQGANNNGGAATSATGATTGGDLNETEGKLVAAATEASLRTYNGVPVGGSSATTPGGGTIAAIPPPAGTTAAVTNQGVAAHGIPATAVGVGLVDGCHTQEDSDMLIAMQMQVQEGGTEDASIQLAKRLQAEENQRVLLQQANNRAAATNNRTTRGNGADKSGCVIL